MPHPPVDPSAPHVDPGHGAASLRCMEIWGGNRASDSAVDVPGLDAWVFARPYGGQGGGGDVHYVSMCSAGRVARVALADVSGHGAEAESASRSLRDLMRRHINTPDGTRLMRSLNEGFGSLGAAGRFATAVFATYFSPTDHLIVCNAGHPRPLWYSAARGAWVAMDGSLPSRIGPEDSPRNLPLGVIAPTPYEQFAVALGPGDLALLYTDCLTESRDATGRMLGEAGLLDVARRIGPREPREFVRRLVEQAVGAAGERAEDDLTVILLHHNAGEPGRLGVRERARSLARQIGLVRV